MGEGDVGCEQSWWVRALGLARDSMLEEEAAAGRRGFHLYMPTTNHFWSVIALSLPKYFLRPCFSSSLLLRVSGSFAKFPSLDSVSKLFPSSSRFPKYNSDVPVFWRCVIKYRKQSLLNPGQHSICLPLTSAIFLNLVPVPQLFGLAHKPTSLLPASTPQPLVLSPQPPGHLFCSNGSCALREGFFL